MIFEVGSPAVALKTLTLADSVKLGASIKKIGNGVSRKAGHALAIVLVIDEDGMPHLNLVGRNPMRLDWHDLHRYLRSSVHAMREASRLGISNEEAMAVEWNRIIALDERLRIDRQRKSARIPWKCEHCGKGYKTERGAVTHERTCTSQPRDAAHRWAGTYGVGVDLSVNRCSCGWNTPALANKSSLGAIRIHFDEHKPVKDTDPTTLLATADASS